MFVLRHELKRHFLSSMIFALSLSFMLAVVVFVYPAMAEDMGGLLSMIESLAFFTEAMNLDISQLNSLIGFYGMEMETMVGIAGSLYAAYLGISLLAKEESHHTAEFLLTHPIKRQRVYLEKLAALLILIMVFNLLIYALALLAIYVSGQTVPLSGFTLIHLASMLVQLNIGLLCYGISAFIKTEMIGLAMGLALILYFFSLLANIWAELAWLRFLTPFQYAFAADILKANQLDLGLIALVFGTSVVVSLIGFQHYSRRDIAS